MKVYQLRFHQKAYEEYIQAYEWYEKRRLGLGENFSIKVEEKLSQIVQYPQFYSRKQNNNFREVKVENFPYMIVYEFLEIKDLIHIAAIYHYKRNPKRKYRKLK